MIIDSHSHYMPPEVAKHTTFFKVHWSDLNRQLDTMDGLRIEKALLLYPTSDAHLQMGGWTQLCTVYNEALSQVVADHPSRFIGAGILPMDDAKDLVAELKRLEGMNMGVLSLASSYDGLFLDDEKFFPVYEWAQGHHVPIHIHSQIINPIGEERVKDSLLSPVLEYVFDVSISVGKLMMSEVFSKFPDLKFIIAHYGGVLPFLKERFDNTYQMLRGRNYVKDLGKLPSEYFKNLYFDTSGSKSPASLLCTLEIADSSHILFGSDFPANLNIAASIDVIRDSDLSAQQKEHILSNDLLRQAGCLSGS